MTILDKISVFALEIKDHYTQSKTVNSTNNEKDKWYKSFCDYCLMTH